MNTTPEPADPTGTDDAAHAEGVERVLRAGLEDFELTAEDRAIIDGFQPEADEVAAGPLPVVAIVGRPNVGKSTLFNRLVGKRLALVDNQPGVTRDLREGDARLGDLRFVVIDSAGLEMVEDDSLQGRMRRLTERAVDEADICLFVIDARAGVTAADEYFADILRRRARHVILAANKAEGRAGESGVLDAYALGLGEPLRISAEHGEGFDDLYGILAPLSDEIEASRPAPISIVRSPVTATSWRVTSGQGAKFRPSSRTA